MRIERPMRMILQIVVRWSRAMLIVKRKRNKADNLLSVEPDASGVSDP